MKRPRFISVPNFTLIPNSIERRRCEEVLHGVAVDVGNGCGE